MSTVCVFSSYHTQQLRELFPDEASGRRGMRTSVHRPCEISHICVRAHKLNFFSMILNKGLMPSGILEVFASDIRLLF